MYLDQICFSFYTENCGILTEVLTEPTYFTCIELHQFSQKQNTGQAIDILN
jgi:hypothetical protein